ncbi:MAG: hypothetical protein LBV54_02825 [Puniceicoccales bacterium]|jgi:hypothetical protein|nr:hypothetical protein [Puniceicoccales bacterium]
MKSKVSFKFLALLPFIGGAMALPMLGDLSTVLETSSPLIEFSDNAWAFATFESKCVYNSNIYASSHGSSDVMFGVTPGVQIEIGKERMNRLTIVAKENFNFHTKHSELNSHLTSVNVNYVYDPLSRFQLTANGDFYELAQNDNTAREDGDLVKRFYFDAAVDASYRLTEKSVIDLGLRFSGAQFENFRYYYNDYRNYSVPISWYYAITDKFSLGFYYSYTYTELDKSGRDRQNASNPAWQGIVDPGYAQIHYGALSFRGSIASKLSLRGSIGVGYQDRSYVARPTGTNRTVHWNNTSLNFSLSADYQVSSKIRTTLTAGRRFDVGAQAQNITNTFADLTAYYSLNPYWQVYARGGYSNQHFNNNFNGTDRLITLGGGVLHIVNKYVTAGLNYRYFRNASSRIEDYGIHQIELMAAVKY